MPPELFPLVDPTPLVALLRPHLLAALPLYSTLQTPGLPTPLYATFPSFESAGNPQLENAQGGLWLVLVDLGNQLRFFCSYEAREHLSDDERVRGEELVVGALTKYLSKHRNNRDRISIGAIPDLWTSCIARAFSQPFSASQIHYVPLDEVPPPSATSAGGVLPGGIVVTEGREEDVEEILSTSEVPHPPSYLSTRLAHTTVLRQLSSSSSPSTSSSPSAPASDEPPSRIVAHCTTHRDGSIGTLHVHPSTRQRGLGRLVLLSRAQAMADRSDSGAATARQTAGGRDAPVFCYVHRDNRASNALMRRAGMRVARGGGEVWWARVRLPLRGEGRVEDDQEVVEGQ